jgi:hypothetical protein
MTQNWTSWEQKVLDTFVRDGRILRLPAKMKKRKVVLRWVTGKIPANVRIPHAEFNALIQRHFADSATIRREMFEFGYVHRDRDFYWRDQASEKES